MEYQFTTNSRIISDYLATYKNTFVAFCELINNSIQANSSEIKIYIEELTGSILAKPITNNIRILDNGSGISASECGKKFFEIGTDVKPQGKGVGRFAAFQIGSSLEIDSVAYDHTKKKFIKTKIALNGNTIERGNLSSIKFIAEHIDVDAEAKTYYQVIIDEIYDEKETQKNKAKKINKNLFLENIEEALFLQYSLDIINEKVSFFINDIALKKEKFVIGDIEHRTEYYIDSKENKNRVELTFINYKSTSKDIRVFLRLNNNSVKTVGYELNYSCDIPDTNSWLVYVDSKLFDDNQDIFRNLLLYEMNIDAMHLIKNLKGFIDKFFSEKFADYVDFSKKLKRDAHYPYRHKDASSDSKSIVFNQLAFYIEKEHKILSENNKIRKIIYPLVDKAINHGELTQYT